MNQSVNTVLRYRELKRLFEKYERALIPGMLIAGVVVDFVTFRSIKISTAFIILAIYFVIAGATIAFINAYDSTERDELGSILKYIRLVAPLIIQFTYGALLSASLIFYWFSGTFSASWPLILIIAFLMTSNEVLRHYYLKPVVQISVYYFILFSLFSLVLPFAFNSISPMLFIVSGILSLVIIFIYIKILSRYIKNVKTSRSKTENVVIAIFACMNALYFFNIIPPIPLSLQDAGAYHQVVRDNGTYTLLAEKESFFDKIIPGQTVHIRPGDKVYVYASIFGPSDLKTIIAHRWEYYDNDKRGWVEHSRPSFPIVGGREGGYRGYSLSSTARAGLWRVSVETERGQVLGRIRFNLEHVETSPELITVVK